jgi:hypothetical protein
MTIRRTQDPPWATKFGFKPALGTSDVSDSGHQAGGSPFRGGFLVDYVDLSQKSDQLR